MTARSLERGEQRIAGGGGGAIASVVREGWLQKEGGATKSKWQNRWFKLSSDKTLQYFVKKDDRNSQGTIQLDEVQDISRVGEHSSKTHCFSLVTTKGSHRKVYYLSADTEELLDGWFTCLKQLMSGATTEPEDQSLRFFKFSTVEIFLTQGVRISGDVPYDILSYISKRAGPEKKQRDSFGWYCDTAVTLATILNLFAEYGWTPEKIYRSSAFAPNDTTVQPVIRVILSKSLSADIVPDQMHCIRGASLKSLGSDVLSPGGTNNVLGCVTIPPGSQLLEGANDDELVELMQEFDIPLSLLVAPRDYL